MEPILRLARLPLLLALIASIPHSTGLAQKKPPVIAELKSRTKVLISSSIDGTKQPSYVLVPTTYHADDSRSVPLVVSLHSWSANLEQRNLPFEREAMRRGWLYVFPNFRGPNRHPDACGSRKAQQDILDAVKWMKNHYRVDGRRIYLTGVSGGGHMTMLMCGRYPKIWAAASAWVGISDLAEWHRKHAKSRYGEMMRKSCGGAPGSSSQVDQEYRNRSPLTFLSRAKGVALDIAAGVDDGHKGSVPVAHSLNAFNIIARANQQTLVSSLEITQLSRLNGHLESPRPSDQVQDKSLGRKIFLRRRAGKSRVTIFAGGHEGIAQAAYAWLETHRLAK